MPTVSVLGSSVMPPLLISTPLSVSVAPESTNVPELVRVAPDASELLPVSVQDRAGIDRGLREVDVVRAEAVQRARTRAGRELQRADRGYRQRCRRPPRQ